MHQLNGYILPITINYNRPGNIRELQNCVERAVILSPGEVIPPADLPPDISSSQPDMALQNAGQTGMSLWDMEWELIRVTLELPDQ